MNTRLHFENFINLVFAFLAFLFLLLFYSFTQTEKEEEKKFCGVVETQQFSKFDDKATIQLGKNLFKNKCGSCHAKNMKTVSTGPPLANVEDRWDNKENLYAWIRNSQAYLAATGDPYVKQLIFEYAGNVMIPFPELTDDDIAAILEYIEFQSR